MARSKSIEVYLEVGQKRTLAGALDWPGWCRSGRDEESALQDLFAYAPRYERVARAAQLAFDIPKKASALVVVERLKGNSTTDFGAPAIAPSKDASAVKPDELRDFEKLLRACWQTLDANIETAAGRSLRTGSRGGGRQLESMIEHLLGGDEGYLNAVGCKLQRGNADDLDQRLEQIRHTSVGALNASARGEMPAKGPRGGIRWTARYFVRRVAWHTLDHAWEIEDRLE